MSPAWWNCSGHFRRHLPVNILQSLTVSSLCVSQYQHSSGCSLHKVHWQPGQCACQGQLYHLLFTFHTCHSYKAAITSAHTRRKWSYCIWVCPLLTATLLLKKTLYALSQVCPFCFEMRSLCKYTVYCSILKNQCHILLFCPTFHCVEPVNLGHHLPYLWKFG